MRLTGLLPSWSLHAPVGKQKASDQNKTNVGREKISLVLKKEKNEWLLGRMVMSNKTNTSEKVVNEATLRR